MTLLELVLVGLLTAQSVAWVVVDVNTPICGCEHERERHMT
ncbi:hypothetical protein M2284_002631 [Rhodococcus sp. LBL1]|nr:hypothetical protein [Rhodococcus sp. LBL1]MDH6684015.1 hypothetical protein [Rhodococcus sp. LBL2]